MTRAILLCLVGPMLFAVSAGAQSAAETVSAPPDVDHELRIPMLAWATGVAADQITTYQFSSHDRDILHETNPFLRGLDRHPILLVAAGTAVDAATGWASYHFLGRRHPLLAKMVFYGASAYRTYLAVYNVQMMHKADAIRASTAAYPIRRP